MLPGLCGIEVLEELRTDDGLKDDSRCRDHRVEPRRDRRPGRGRRSLRLEAVRPGRAQHRGRGVARMTLARRMWLASAALALLVGAAFTALILAVSAQREATDREARSKDVSAASLQLEKLVVGHRDRASSALPSTGKDEFPRRRTDRHERQLPATARRACTPSSRTIRARKPTRPGDREPDPGVRLRTSSAGRSRCCDEEPGLVARRPERRAGATRSQTDEIRRLFNQFRSAERHSRRASEPGRRPPDQHRRARWRCRGRSLDGADRPLRDRAGALDRPSGARGRRRSQQDRGRRARAAAAGGGPWRGRRADTRVQRDGGAARGEPPRARGRRTRSCARASAGRPSSSASSPTSCGRRSQACSGSRRCC